ncbi:spore maturation protein A [Clostridium tetani]|uniref:Spore maturation protein n=1 Tax=Clostridium tetani TaxID=1513 RepID=A0A4Q0VBG3_CLOTA|nr:nucleoside recognition domain-containing protein [Clostridium tetani]CDI48289.1 spore maturation protein A [Clostridium tetani 12124569]AVP55422.1 spore maturation protein [Clostridium tetani]KHO40304.1 spore maturation protein [Clostridium tetani]RXI41111.1 spore maturation protein [Clostridium tetani]RXI47964.1 spore maturation protein [Clostridium tetani]
MVNYIWFFILVIGIVVGIITGRGELMSKVIISSTTSSVDLIIKLLGIMSLWCGIMKIAEKSGLTDKLAKILKPILRLILKDAGKDDKTLGSIVMNITANMMGLSNAATPFGIKAMENMQEINLDKDTASDDMAMFLVLNAACIQIIPTTIISIRAASGSNSPADIILPSILTTGMAGIVGIISCKILEKYF